MKASAGPNLNVEALAGMKKMPSPQGDPFLLRVIVHNTGVHPTTLTNLGLRHRVRVKHKIRRQVQPLVIINFEGPQFPYRLEVGGEWMRIVEQDAKFDEMLASRMLSCIVYHSFSNKPVETKIVMPPDLE